MTKRLVVFAPHPDDETLGCGGTIAKKVREGFDVIIVVMTNGEHAFSTVLGIDSDPTPEELKHVRAGEIMRAAMVLGVPNKNLTFLNFEDGCLWQNKEEAQERVEDVLARDSPVEIYFPYEKDYNVDHRAANRIILDSARRVGSSALKHQYSITQKYSRVGPVIDRLLNIFNHSLVIVDVSEFLALKDAAIKEFRSQIGTISKAQKRPILTKVERFLKNEEVFYVK